MRWEKGFTWIQFADTSMENSQRKHARARGKGRSIRTARFYKSEEIGLETGRETLWSRYWLDLSDYSRSFSRASLFLALFISSSVLHAAHTHGLPLVKLDISTLTLTWLKETQLGFTYLEERDLRTNSLQFPTRIFADINRDSLDTVQILHNGLSHLA